MKKEYFIKMEDGTRVKVSRDVFKQYWKVTNRENYLRRLDRKYGGVSLDAKADCGNAFINLVASDFDLEKVVETALLVIAIYVINERTIYVKKKLKLQNK